MKMIPYNEGPFLRAPFYTRPELENLCESALHEAGALPRHPSPVEVSFFIESAFQIELLYQETEPGIAGFTRFSGGRPIRIVVSSELSDPDPSCPDMTEDTRRHRCRSTEAHEAGHALLHGSFYADIALNPKSYLRDSETSKFLIACRTQDLWSSEGHIVRTHRNPLEVQANMTMAFLLMPQSLLPQALDLAGFSGTLTYSHIQRVAEIFDVSRQLAKIRLTEWCSLHENPPAPRPLSRTPLPMPSGIGTSARKINQGLIVRS